MTDLSIHPRCVLRFAQVMKYKPPPVCSGLISQSTGLALFWLYNVSKWCKIRKLYECRTSKFSGDGNLNLSDTFLNISYISMVIFSPCSFTYWVPWSCIIVTTSLSSDPPTFTMRSRSSCRPPCRTTTTFSSPFTTSAASRSRTHRWRRLWGTRCVTSTTTLVTSNSHVHPHYTCVCFINGQSNMCSRLLPASSGSPCCRTGVWGRDTSASPCLWRNHRSPTRFCLQM